MPKDAARNELDIELLPGATIEGRVVDAARAPVAGATVRGSGTLRNTESNQQSGSSSTVQRWAGLHMARDADACRANPNVAHPQKSGSSTGDGRMSPALRPMLVGTPASSTNTPFVS